MPKEVNTMKLLLPIFNKMKAFLIANKPAWLSFQNTVFIVFFTILPFICGFILSLLFQANHNLYAQGEFFLYSVSLISSSLLSYQSMNNYKELLNGGLNKFSLILLVLVAITYALLVSNSATPDLKVVKVFSFTSFGVAILLFFYSQYLFNNMSPDVGAKRRQEQSNIEDSIG